MTACLFDLDGVLTQTAKVHAAAWQQMFDDYLRRRAAQTNTAFVPFDPVRDYDEYVDGKPRYDGVRSFLTARGIELPEGEIDDPPDAQTIHGLGNRKNEIVLKLIHEQGVEPYAGSVAYVKAAREAGLRRAVVSSSTNCRDVLHAAGIEDLFEADRRRRRRRARAPARQARARHVSGGRARVGGRARARGRVRGRARRRRGWPRGALRLRRRRRSRRPGRRAARPTAPTSSCAISANCGGRRDRAPRSHPRAVIQHMSYVVEPWVVRETGLDLDKLAQSESVFALSNGHIGLRGNLDEGEPFGLPGTYLAGFSEQRPLPYAEAGYGYPEAGQTVINVTNGKIIRLLVEDEPLDIRYGELRDHERVLDLRAGVLQRTLEWRSPAGRSVRISSTRLVSFAQRAVAAILYEVQALDGKTPVVVQSELVANEELPGANGDPRAAAALASPLVSEYFGERDTRAVLAHSTRASGLTMAAAMDHIIDGPADTQSSAESFADIARLLVSADVEPGKPLRVVKFLAYGWSGHRSRPAVVDQVSGALLEARHRGWDGLLADQREYLDDFWERADVEIEGDAELQQAVRFGLFHVLQAGARAERRAIAAKGLTGPGYDGHAFWDTETFVLPVLTYTAPHAARDALLWRHETLELAQERARSLGLAGAAFPWRTIHGQECSSYWPAGTAAFHINADIADAVLRYQAASEDDEAFASGEGLELLVETARLWRSLGHHDAAGRFRIDGVTGPDEYSAIADNNIYTNLMAERNLRAAVRRRRAPSQTRGRARRRRGGEPPAGATRRRRC